MVEFEDYLARCANAIGNNPYLMEEAIYNGFDVNWFFNCEIPDDIEQIHRDLRARGYLK